MEIRKPEQLQNVNSLIIPGGESTTMAKLAEFHNLVSTRFFFLLFLFVDLFIDNINGLFLSNGPISFLNCSFLPYVSLLKWESLYGGPVQVLSSWQTRQLVGFPFLPPFSKFSLGFSFQVNAFRVLFSI